MILDQFAKKLFSSKPGKDSNAKSLLKSISWRIVGTIDTIIISYIITGQLVMAVSIGSVEVVSKIILYYFHERVWENATKEKINEPATELVRS
ncbi:MAG: DUF2061 domain-containing protein [Algoriphagus sp.]|jgi:uncharacterized membrane protein|uniref:DUF2061 domain-containing protein n=1 Tax=Algoriphagus sp. TaxID=1872435 RepID=UPI002722BD3D|nr:DUF2061 domain-containing protein [Algoriphagus sp.]MDO8968467.1 DUF2061 domain-containing protein [Algoriphagus sp.]MDP2041182.1 DUF2061 domain-containing protein [Algoriphagus sp.]MDP3200756.1 DUF2061 domain-containing protein [Algoriphagus sp.]MDP3471231.1 DUF2061 domain-containing protein [Algoriphagus sp.]